MLEIISRSHLIQLQQCVPTPCRIDLRTTSVVIQLFYMSHPLLSYCKCLIILTPFIHPARRPISVPPLTSVLVIIHVPSSNTSSLPDLSLHYFRVFLFAFRLLKIESNHEHELSWARKIHTTVPFHQFRVFLFAFRLLKIESNHEHELSWARKIPYSYDPFPTHQFHVLPDHPRHHTLNKGSLSPPTLLA